MKTPTDRPESHCIATDEQRRESRVLIDPGTDYAVVWQQPGDELLYAVHDESLHGLCLVTASAAKFPVGATATIIFHHDCLDAVVRHVDAQADGSYLVGFECRPVGQTQP